VVPGDPAYLAAQRADLLRFAAGARHELGFGYLDERGAVDGSRPVELWITCRMTHVLSLGTMAGEPPAPGGPDGSALSDLARHGVVALRGPLRDRENRGWFAAVDATGPVTPAKQAYGHAFVVLAAASASAAGVPGADDLLAEALLVQDRFWQDDHGLVVDEWDRGWERLDDYRGVNANMHTVEAYLAAGDVTGETRWHKRAGRIAATVAGWARTTGWRVPEHFDTSWRPLPEHHRDRPADPFRPYGATVGHGLEWARLLVAVDATLAQPPPELVGAAVRLFDRAVTDGWDVDGATGFVYTTDWDGRPVVRARMHWVLAEAVAAAEVLGRVTGERRYGEWRDRWWRWADEHLVDHEHGSWHHELDTRNVPAGRTWPGKPDVYHAYQAALLPALPVVPSFAAALRQARS
jgi:mannose/cellobiose epimerase-like protein (N-acyl-D-glucosamine 2-epimerase family)